MNVKLEKFCKSNKKADRDGAKLFFKILEAYILIDLYKIDL